MSRFLEALLGGIGRVSGLVYVFIALCGVGLGAAAYFGLTFSLIEAALLALIAALGGVAVLERSLRHRAEARLEKGISDLSRLLSTDAQAGQILSQRINALADLDIGARLDVMEADISVLGTVIRQVAEAVSDLETRRGAPEATAEPEAPARGVAPAVPLAVVEEALDQERMVHHVQPIVTLPQRKTHGYWLVPRLMTKDGDLLDPPAFLPAPGGAGDRAIRRIERLGVERAVSMVRRARVMGRPARVFVPLSQASLADAAGADAIASLIAAQRAVAPDLVFALDDADWADVESEALKRLNGEGAGLAIFNAKTLRRDFAALAARGVRYIGVDAGRFLTSPAALTDFHAADVSDYARRFGIQIVTTGVASEAQILSLLDDRVGLAQGPAIAAPGPIEAGAGEPEDQMQRAAIR